MKITRHLIKWRFNSDHGVTGIVSYDTSGAYEIGSIYTCPNFSKVTEGDTMFTCIELLKFSHIQAEITIILKKSQQKCIGPT